MRVAKERDDRRDARRARDQGGRARRPARARAPGRLRAPVRGRARAHLPDAARAQEPLRLDQRGRASSRWRTRASSRCSTPARASSSEATGAPGSVVLASHGGLAAAARRRSRRWSRRPSSCRRGGCRRDRPQPARAGARGARPPRGRRRSARRDVFVNVVGGVRVDEPGADLAVALAVASAAQRRCRSGAGGSPRCFGEIGPDRRAAAGRPRGAPRWPRRRVSASSR